MEKTFKISFLNGSAAKAIHSHSVVDLSESLKTLGLQKGRRVLVVIGGASKLSEEDFARVQLLFENVLAPLAEKWGATVVDGGTDAGVMKLMGQARANINALFPLIGILPIGLAILPDRNGVSPDAAPLEPNHTHFLLVPGSNWGDESPWIAQAASELAGDKPSVTVLINGGDVTWKDAYQNILQGRSIIVIAGSGRTADLIAATLRGEAIDQRAQDIINTGLVQAIDLTTGHKALIDAIEAIFAVG